MLIAGVTLMVAPSSTTYVAPPPTVLQVETIEIKQYVPTLEDVERINAKIEVLAAYYSVSPEIMKHIVYNESRYNVNAVGDINFFCQTSQKYEASRGLVQINSCFHPIKQDAYNEDFALDFLAKNLSEGRCHIWSTCPLKGG